MSQTKRKVNTAVIGSGPGGYVAAIKLGQLGVETLLVERDPVVGGVCLNRGCIPSKALISATHRAELADTPSMGITLKGAEVDLEALQAWKNGVVDRLRTGVTQLLKANRVEVLQGTAAFTASNTLEVAGPDGTELIDLDHAILATGSTPIQIPGFEFDGENIISSTGALELASVPERMVVIGGGYIGLELGTVWAKLGARVTVLEMLEQLLPGFPRDIVSLVARKLRKLGVQVHTRARASGWQPKDDGIEVTVEPEKKEPFTIEADKVLVTVGRRPHTAGLGLEKAGIELDERGFVKVDGQLRTTADHIFAIGDVAGEPMLAHKASAEAEIAAQVIARKKARFEPRGIPAVVFTDPEIASVGLTRAEAKARELPVKVGKFPFMANGRALTAGVPEGFVRVIADEKSHKLLGVEIIGPEASNLISEATLALELGATLEQLGNTIHPHPTLSETLMEAAKAALGEAIHAVNR